MSLLDNLPKPEKNNGVIDYAGILQILPHRYPFLMIDNVVSYELEKKITCQKNVSFNEPYFQGHFPNDPVMPGVMQVEAMAQAGCVLMFLSYEEQVKGKRPAFMGVKECRFRRPVRPGDVLRIETEIVSFRRMIATLKSEVYVGDVLVSDSLSTATMI